MSKEQVKDLLMEHFMNPRNVGELADADGVGEVGNPVCGDFVRLSIKVKDNKIQKSAFKTFGCRAAIATSSVLTEIIQGKTVDAALKLGKDDMVKALGELPPLKQHCTKLAEFALKAALGDYFVKSRSDRTLADEISRRIHDLQEWRAAGSEEEALLG
jgi:nitrogen fixation protein NifU and related proteins